MSRCNISYRLDICFHIGACKVCLEAESDVAQLDSYGDIFSQLIHFQRVTYLYDRPSLSRRNLPD